MYFLKDFISEHTQGKSSSDLTISQRLTQRFRGFKVICTYR